jgi:hypothetical protein
MVNYEGLFNVKLIGMCPRLFVQLKEIPGHLNESSKVIFVGQDQPHIDYFDARVKNLPNLVNLQSNTIGFATDYKHIFQKYLDEYHRLAELEIPIQDMPDYLQTLVKKHLGVNKEELMAE